MSMRSGSRPISPLMQTEVALTLDFDKSIDLLLHFQAPTEASVAHTLQAAKTLRDLAELALEKTKESGESGARSWNWKGPW